MSETSEEQREERRKPSGFNSLTGCHDDAAAHSMETVANGSEETVSSRGGLPRSRNTSSHGSGFDLHAFLYCDHSTSSSAGRVGRGGGGAGNADGSSGSSFFSRAPNLSGWLGNRARNRSCVEPEQKRLLESCSGGNGVVDDRLRLSNTGRGSLDRSSSLGGCDEDLATRHHAFLNGCLNSMDEPRLGRLSPTVESGVMPLEASIENADAGEQTDAGYIDMDGDAFADSSNDASSALHGSHSGSHSGGSGIHFAFDVEASAAGGGGSVGGGLEDFGDFIDADIPRNRNGSSQFSSRSNDSLTSSFEELAVAVDNAGAEQADDVVRGGDRPRPNSMALQSTPRQPQGSERVLDFPVNNLNQVDRRRTTATGSTDDILATTQSQSSTDSASMTDSMNFASGVARSKSWRWSDGDAVGNILPSMVAAASQTSDSSYGTPSVPLVSPFSVEEDEVLASATTSPLTPGRPQVPRTLEFDPVRCSNNLEGARKSRDDDARGDAAAARRPSVLEPNFESASFSGVDLLQNLNQSTPKHLLEKYFGWEATTGGSAPTNASASKHSLHRAGAAVEGLQSEDCVDAGCHQCGSRTENELNGSGSYDFPENFDWHSAERCPGNPRSDAHKNRRFSCQNPIVTDSLEFSDGSSSARGRGRAWDSADAMTVSDDNLHSTHFAKHPQPMSLHWSWHSNHDYVECGHSGKSGRNADLLEMGGRSKDAKAKKLSSEALFLSLSEDDDDDEDGEEGEVGHPRRHRSKNGRQHDVRCRDDRSQSRLTDVPSVTTSCGACLIIILLRQLGVTDVSHRVYELMHANHPLDKASLPEYLLASSTTGVDAETLVDRLAQLTENRIYGKFFHLFPQRNINLIHWLKYWVKKGAVPLATLMRETKPASNDVWHHKIINTKWIQAVNDAVPAAVEDDLSWIGLSSDSSIRISRHQIVTRWRDDCDLNILMSCNDTRWQEMNVLGQVVNILREERLQTVGSCKPQLTSHVVIPTHFKSGVTLYLRKDSAGYKELQRTGAELPMADCITQDSALKTSLSHDKNQRRKRDVASGVKETVIF